MSNVGVALKKLSQHGFRVSMVTKGIHSSPQSQGLQFHPSQIESSRDKAVVVLFGWLLAKSKHLEKYAEMYQKHGADILTVQLEVSEVLRPKKAEQTALKVLEKLTSSDVNQQPIVVHGFSVGGYLYSQVLNQVVTKEQYNPVKQRILGQIFDSPVDFQGIPHGISNAATKNPVLRMLMKNGIKSYLSLTSKYTSKIYVQRSELFYNMPMECPSMFLFSKSDIVSDCNRIEVVADHWKKDLKIDVTAKCWDTSPHVSHFYAHPKEYTSMVESFFKRVMNY